MSLMIFAARFRVSFLLLFLPYAFTNGWAEESWSRFRGPNGSGVAPPEWLPPIKPEAARAAWKVSVPVGHSSPVIAGDRVFLTGFVDGRRLVTLAFDRTTGTELWRREVPEVAKLEPVHETSSPAASTPHVDGERVYAYFGSYGVLCYDHEGELLWSKSIPTPKTLYGMASSPIGYGGLLILVLDDDENLPDSKLSRSRILALEKATGEVAWETARPLHRSGWSTPMIWEHAEADGGDELVVLGNGRVCGYSARTGTEKWFAGGFSRETVAVPVAGDGRVYVASAQLGGGADEDIDPLPLWDAIIGFDTNGDGRIERAEMTEHFTFPLRPELPLGHPGFGIPMPADPAKRSERLDGMVAWVDKDKDGFWTKAEFAQSLSFRQGKPLLIAIRPGGTGDIADSHLAWELNRSVPEVPSPVFHDGRLYLVRNGGFIAAVNAGNGELVYRERLSGGGQYSASPIIANGHLFAVSSRGVVSVVKPGDTFEQVHHFDLEEPVFVTPAADVTTLYFRTEGNLWAFRRE